MKSVSRRKSYCSLLALTFLACSRVAAQDPLPSWNDDANKRAILQFVGDVTRQGSSSFVPQDQRIATFDNDGTLWVEQPMYTQLAFAIARVKTLAAQHPEWKQQQPFKAVLDGDIKALASSGERGLVQLIMATHAGMTTSEFAKIAEDWINTAQHPRFHRPYTAVPGTRKPRNRQASAQCVARRVP